MEISDLVVSDRAATAEGSAGMFADTRRVFEQWLHSLNASPILESEPARKNAELKTFGETYCDVIFDGVLQIDSLVKGNIRSAYGTLMMSKEGRVARRAKAEACPPFRDEVCR